MAKAKTPLHFDLPSETELERSEVLFTLGTQEFKVQPSKVINPDVLMETMNELEKRNPLVVMREMLQKVLGEEQYAEFKKLSLTPEIFTGVTKATMEHLSSAYVEEDDDAKGKA